MSTIIKFDLKELRKLLSDKNSCVIEKKVTQNLALQPWALGNLKESIKNILDYKIGKYDKEYNGILLSYKNLRVLQNVGTIKNDNADIHFQVQADYFIFRPFLGAMLKGVVNKKSPTHLAVLVHRVFNVVIPRPTEAPGNKWIGSGVQEGQEVIFRIAALDLFGALPYIRGELDERSLQQSCEDETVELKSLTQNSYVNFDKTKPNTQKQIGDGFPPQAASRKPLTGGKVEANKTVENPDKLNSICQSEGSLTNKNKTKRQSKVGETDSKPTDINQKQSKKHKKDLN